MTESIPSALDVTRRQPRRGWGSGGMGSAAPCKTWGLTDSSWRHRGEGGWGAGREGGGRGHLCITNKTGYPLDTPRISPGDPLPPKRADPQTGSPQGGFPGDHPSGSPGVSLRGIHQGYPQGGPKGVPLGDLGDSPAGAPLGIPQGDPGIPHKEDPPGRGPRVCARLAVAPRGVFQGRFSFARSQVWSGH